MFGTLKKGMIFYKVKKNNVMQTIHRFTIFIVITFFLHGKCLCQPIYNLDSLENILKTEKTDTTILKAYIKILADLKNDQIEAKKIFANWIINNSNNKSSLYIYVKAHELLALSYARVSDYGIATDLYNKAILISETNNFYDLMSVSLNGLANVYKNLDQLPASITYYKKGLEIAEKNNFLEGIGLNKFGLAGTIRVLKVSSDLSTINQDSLQLKFRYFNDGIKIWESLKDTIRLIRSNIQTGESYANYELFDSAFSKMARAKMYLSNPNFERYYLDYYFTSGKVYVRKATANNNNKADLLKAIDYLKLSYPLAIKYNELNYKMWYYDWMHISYKRLNDYKTAYEYKIQYDNLDDSLTGEENFKKIADVQHKFDNKKKENELLNTKAENKQKSNLNKILFGSAIGLILFSLFGYRSFKNKQKISAQQQEIQKQTINELEKDKQLSAIDAMLQGQEEERSRIAKDLHDGLGGMLSGAKLSFINMKENLVLTPENATQFDKSLSMLDNTIADLRKVAHNLMPEALVKFGLQEAVRDFCNSIQSSSNLKVVYQPLGVQNKLSNTAEVFTYRIIQELVNNAVKHASATQIIVQLTTNNNKVGIAVEDDGKGFDVNALANSKGAGMDNIKYRVQYFNGTIDTVTSAGNGTSVNIELNV